MESDIIYVLCEYILYGLYHSIYTLSYQQCDIVFVILLPVCLFVLFVQHCCATNSLVNYFINHKIEHQTHLYVR